MKKPKIIAFMNAYSQGKSGGDMVFIEIAKRIKNYDKVIITSLLGKKLCQKCGLQGKYLITTSEQKFRNVIWTYLKRIVKAFFLKLEVEKNDVFLGTSDFLPDILPIFFLKLRNRKNKWVQHIFHLIPSNRKIPFLAQKVSFLLIKNRADLIIVDNSLLKKDLIKLGFREEKIKINYPGINLDYLKKVKPAKKSYEGVFMAQLRPSKGIFDLIKIWKLVVRKKPKAKLWIIGRGSEEILKKLNEEIKKEKLDKNIEILGYLEDDIALSLIKASRVFLFPSYEEGFGIAGLEAQSLGLPVIAWNLPVFEEIFPKGMIKLKKGRIKEFSEKILELLENKSLYQNLSKEAKENAERFNWEKATQQELKLIQKLLL